jgi:hypothetical protein
MATVLNVIGDTLRAGLQSGNSKGALTLSTIAALTAALTGDTPVIIDRGNYSDVEFKPEQIKKLRLMLENALNGTGEPGAARVALGPVLYPVILKRLIPLLLIIFAIGYISHR